MTSVGSAAPDGSGWSTQIDAATGRLDGATGGYRKMFAELRGVFQDDEALEATIRQRPDGIAYEVHEYRRSDDEGDVVFGTSTIHPGVIGREYNMTRGHRHRIADRAELYYCVAGTGVLLLQGPDGVAHPVPMATGTAAYVPPHAQHRTINVGDGPMVTVFCYPADSGQDYDIIERHGGMQALVVTAPGGGWTVEPNPRFRASPMDPPTSAAPGTR